MSTNSQLIKSYVNRRLKTDSLETKREIEELRSVIKLLNERIDVLEEHVKYMPGGDGFIDAKKDFEERRLS